jgi:hypothetical protein
LPFLHILTSILCLGYLPHPLPDRTCSTLLFSVMFCWRENISYNKKDIALLLGWGKDSYAERYLALFPCICAWQPTLLHLYQTSSLLSSPLPIVASATLFTSLELAHKPHQVLGFLPFPYSFCACSHLSVWTMSNNITAFVLDL